jgi:hypothetical protein
MKTHAAGLVFLVSAVVMCAAGPAGAQAGVPRVEFGATGNVALAGRFVQVLPGTRVGVAINNRFAIESDFNLWDWNSTPEGSHQFWSYLIQVKQRVRPGKQPGDGVFFTYGGGSFVSHSHTNAQHFTWDGRSVDYPARSSTYMSPPFGAAGVASQTTVARHLAIRSDAQMLIAPYGGIGFLVSAGVSIPIGGHGR